MATNVSVTGTDGIAPSYSPNGLWAIWDINVIFNGGAGAGMYVPKVNDYVINPTAAVLYIVTALNTTTYISTLQQIEIANLPILQQNPNKIIAPFIPNTSNPYRLYFNSSTTPYTLNIDSFLAIVNPTAAYAKIFMGNDYTTDSAGASIGITLDNNGIPVSDAINLISYTDSNNSNQYMKLVPTAYTNQLLQNGDMVTIVFYNATGSVCSFEYLTVVETNGFVGINAPSKIVTGLSLGSPFVSDSDPNTLLLPSNVSAKDLVINGIVNYNDGTQMALPVNQGGQMMLYGLSNATQANILGSMPLVLQYTLGVEEKAMVNLNYNGKVVTNQFVLRSAGPNFAYQYQLYPVPIYAGSSNGFVVKWYLLSMSRNIFIDVSNIATFSTGSNFAPTEYGVAQAQTVSVTLDYISNLYSGLNYSQTVGLTLNDPTTGPSTIYSISTNLDISKVPYGTNIRAKSLNSANTTLDISNGYYQLTDWLNAVYYANLPVTNPQLESSAPAPTHFDIISNPGNQLTETFMSTSQSTRFQIGDWNTSVVIGSQSIPMNSTILIRFLQIIGDSTLILSISPMTITSY